MRCDRSGVIFLSRTNHLTDSHYANQSDLSYWSADDRRQAVLDCFDDDRRRAQQFASLIRNQRWLDVGTGVGGILDLLGDQAAEVCAVEPQPAARQALTNLGYRIYADLPDVEDDSFDVVTLFHVFEHLPHPLEVLRTISRKLTSAGRVVIEVPHANDLLISFFDLEEFKKFTFWSEHLILHTRQTLEIFLRESGFTDIEMSGYQRYPLANHLYWLAKGRPGGHKEWAVLLSEDLDRAYREKLCELDRTDTLIAVARK